MTTRKLTMREKQAMKAIAKLKYDENDELIFCKENDRYITLAEIMLGGRDPLAFATFTIGNEYYVEPDMSTVVDI